MRRAVTLSTICPAFLAAGAPLSCGPGGGAPRSDEAQKYAAAVCAAREACGCTERFKDDEQCEGILADRFDKAALERGVAPECLDKLATRKDVLCAPLDTWSTVDRCPLLSREGKEGDPCSAHLDLPLAFVDDCADGLTCSHGSCRSTPTPLPGKSEGSSCNSEVPTTCGAIDLYCGDDDVCHVTGLSGEECVSAYDCYEDTAILYCAGVSTGDGVCAPKPLLGEACDPLDYYPCAPNATGKTTATWCDPASNTCVVGNGPAACEALGVPFAWP